MILVRIIEDFISKSYHLLKLCWEPPLLTYFVSLWAVRVLYQVTEDQAEKSVKNQRSFGCVDMGQTSIPFLGRRVHVYIGQ